MMRDSELIELKPKRLEYWWEGEKEGRERESSRIFIF